MRTAQSHEPKKMKGKLNARQEAFARNLIFGQMRAKDAYIAAGYSGRNADSSASRMSSLDKIETRMVQLRAELSAKSLVTAERWDEIVSEGAEMPWTYNGKENAAKLKCLDWLGEIHGRINRKGPQEPAGDTLNIFHDNRVQVAGMSIAALARIAEENENG